MPPKSTECVLFDFFGTLVEYSASRVEQGYPHTHRLLEEHGIDIGYDAFLDTWAHVSGELDEWSAATGREFSMDTCCRRFFDAVAPRSVARPELIHTFRDSYLHEWSSTVRYLPGVGAMLRSLAPYRLGIVTNTHHAPLVHAHLQRMGVQDAFANVTTSVEHGRPKPHTGIFAAALDALGCRAGHTVFVGDSYSADYLGATQAGMRGLLIDPNAASPAPACDRIASVLDVTHVLSRES